ncbi:Uncharacterised protein r2_g711 [Pycnogonum litorale]
MVGVKFKSNFRRHFRSSIRDKISPGHRVCIKIQKSEPKFQDFGGGQIFLHPFVVITKCHAAKFVITEPNYSLYPRIKYGGRSEKLKLGKHLIQGLSRTFIHIFQ